MTTTDTKPLVSAEVSVTGPWSYEIRLDLSALTTEVLLSLRMIAIERAGYRAPTRVRLVQMLSPATSDREAGRLIAQLADDPAIQEAMRIPVSGQIVQALSEACWAVEPPEPCPVRDCEAFASGCPGHPVEA